MLGHRRSYRTDTDISSLPYKTPWNFYREGMILPVFACICILPVVLQAVCSVAAAGGTIGVRFPGVSLRGTSAGAVSPGTTVRPGTTVSAGTTISASA